MLDGDLGDLRREQPWVLGPLPSPPGPTHKAKGLLRPCRINQGPEASLLLGSRWHSPCMRGAATFPSPHHN